LSWLFRVSLDFTLRIEPFLGRAEEIGCRRPLNPTDVTVMFIRSDVTADAAQRAALVGLLCDEERRRMDRFRFESDRNLFLVAHALVRLTLSRYADVGPGEWRFKAGPHGRPEIAAPKSNFRFTLSHTQGLAACAINMDRDIGIDIEDASRRVELNVAERFFSSREVLDLRSLPPGAQPSRFLEYWTLKEAYIKATGLGLSAPLDSFSFYQDPHGAWQIEFDAGSDDDPARWKFWSFKTGVAHTTALAVALPSAANR
jgi:4'-phosphopantetheinyl transferase